jgi:hypothetical protein
MMVLTSRINLAIGIDMLGHESFFQEVFYSMGFARSKMAIVRLRKMWKRKEYGWMHSGLWKVKRKQRIRQRDRMIEGMAKLELDAKEGRGGGAVQKFEWVMRGKTEIGRRQKERRRKLEQTSRAIVHIPG